MKKLKSGKFNKKRIIVVLVIVAVIIAGGIFVTRNSPDNKMVVSQRSKSRYQEEILSPPLPVQLL